jgi:GAF domain-containing protein
MKINNKPRPISTPPSDENIVLRDKILRYILIGADTVGGLTYFAVMYTAVRNNQWALVAIFSALYLWALTISFARNLPFNVRAYSFVTIVYLLGVVSLMGSGLSSGNGVLFILAFVTLSTALISFRTGVIAGILSVLTIILLGIAFTNKLLPLPFLNFAQKASSLTLWIINAIVMLTLSTMIVSALGVLTVGLSQFLRNQKKLTEELGQERFLLERRVQERTTELEKRASQQQAASQIARTISSQPSLETLLNVAVQQVQQRFGYYHCGIFLNDEHDEYAILRAATGDAGRKMLEAGHKLRIGEEGIVGNVISRGEPRIAVDVGADATHFRNPYLPETRSEIALPLRSEDQIIGALDVQSRQELAFTKEDLDMLQTIADQLAAAIAKINLVENLQNKIKILENRYAIVTQQTWRNFLRQTHRHTAFRFSPTLNTLTPGEGASSQEAQLALQRGLTITATRTDETPQTTIAIPIKLRDQILGVLDVQFATNQILPDTQKILETAANRLGVALDNARLLEELQSRAEREHLVSDISTKIRSTSQIDQILHTAAEQLGRALGVSQVIVQLRKQEQPLSESMPSGETTNE